MEDILKFMLLAVIVLFILAVSFKIDKQDKIINAQKNRIQQQIELIDALQQREGN